MSINREAIYERDQGVCGFCGEPVAREDLDLDHVLPAALGGETVALNLRVAHARCNRSAGWQVRKQIGGPLSAPTPVDLMHLEVAADLGKQVRELAAREHRSLTAQVQLLLRQALAATGEALAA